MPFNLICYTFPLFYKACQEANPPIQVIPVEGSTRNLESRLISGSIDFAVIPIPLYNPSQFNSKIIIEEQMVLSVPETHWLNEKAEIKEGCKRPYIDLSLADRQPFVMNLTGQRVRQASEVLLKSAGITPKISFVTRNTSTKITISALGLGLAIFPEHYLAFSNPPKGANYYYISGSCDLKWTVAIVWRKDTYISNACKQCFDVLENIFDFY